MVRAYQLHSLQGVSKCSTFHLGYCVWRRGSIHLYEDHVKIHLR